MNITYAFSCQENSTSQLELKFVFLNLFIYFTIGIYSHTNLIPNLFGVTDYNTPTPAIAIPWDIFHMKCN